MRTAELREIATTLRKARAPDAGHRAVEEMGGTSTPTRPSRYNGSASRWRSPWPCRPPFGLDQPDYGYLLASTFTYEGTVSTATGSSSRSWS